MDNPITDLAFSILEAHRKGETKISRKGGNFLGECVVDPQPLTEKQAAWLNTLAERAGKSPLTAKELGQ